MVKVNYASIAQVCGTTADIANYILKDIISRALSMAKNNLVRLNFKIGHVIIQNYRVNFEATGSGEVLDYTTSSFNKLIGRKINHSFGGHSSKLDLSVRTSVRTPMSYISACSGMSKNIHASNPNPQVGPEVHPNFNKTMYNAFMGKDTGEIKRQVSATRGKTLPFPFVSGMIGGHSYTKPGKRVFFNKRLGSKDVLKHQLAQINYNLQKRENDYQNEKNQDKIVLKSIKDNLKKEEFKRKQFKDHFRDNYKMYNDNKQIENQNEKRMHSEAKKGEKYNFFPFTHGDEIEKKRITQKIQLTNELRNRSDASTYERAMMTRSFTDGLKSNGFNSTGNSMKAGFRTMKSVNGRVPIKYMTEYPTFLTPFKQYPYRRLNDTHVEATMQSAVKRYENDILKIQQEREEEAERFQQQMYENSNYQEELEIKKKKAQVENKRMLLEQMQRENYNRLKQKLEAKEMVNTNFGPEENEQTLNMRKSFQQKNIEDIKKSLERQMKEKHQLTENEKLQERLEELETVQRAKLVMMQEREELENKDKNAKDIYKNAWKEQIKMKALHKKTDDLFRN